MILIGNLQVQRGSSMTLRSGLKVETIHSSNIFDHDKPRKNQKIQQAAWAWPQKPHPTLTTALTAVDMAFEQRCECTNHINTTFTLHRHQFKFVLIFLYSFFSGWAYDAAKKLQLEVG